MATPPSYSKHIASLDQKYPEDEYIPQIEPRSNLQQITDNKENNPSQSQPQPQPQQTSPAPALVDMVALITPKQIKNSKKWSVGINYTSTAIIFEYLETARLSIQNDGRLFLPGPKKTLTATHSSLASHLTSIPRISHISVPHTIYFNNNSVVRINTQWHIGQLLPIMYTANINPPITNNKTPINNNNNNANNEYNMVHSALSNSMLVDEKPLSSDIDDDSDDVNNNETETESNCKPQYIKSPSRSYLHMWSSATDTLINMDMLSTKNSHNIIAINKILHDHNHNHDFFWSHYYDHSTAYYNKTQSDDDHKGNSNENKSDCTTTDNTYTKFLKYLRDNEDENSNIDVKTQISLIKMDLLNAIRNNNNQTKELVLFFGKIDYI
eukprot:452691_1